MTKEFAEAYPPEVQDILMRVGDELNAFWQSNQVGTIILHCGASQTVIEVNRKLDPVKREAKPKTAMRRGWESP